MAGRVDRRSGIELVGVVVFADVGAALPRRCRFVVTDVTIADGPYPVVVVSFIAGLSGSTTVTGWVALVVVVER